MMDLQVFLTISLLLEGLGFSLLLIQFVFEHFKRAAKFF